MSPVNDASLLHSATKKRKLKHPRTARACAFCRKRKVRCSGTYPCEYCVTEGVTCDYEGSEAPTSRAAPRPQIEDTGDTIPTRRPKRPSVSGALHVSGSTPSSSRQPSADSSSALVEGQQVGPISGVSYLYHPWNQADQIARSAAPASLTSYGDFPQKPARNSSQRPSQESIARLFDMYFRFASPTYRFLHRPSLEAWAEELVGNIDGQGSAPRFACVLIACAQSLLYTRSGDRYKDGGDEDLDLSRSYYEGAKSLLDHEQGPVNLASVQARLAMCLYLLTTFRINECRYSFSFACTVLTSLDLHRKTSSADRLGLVEAESRKRTFWCAYILDGYLSVMLGRPRLFRDEDVDQPFPRNIDDQDLMSTQTPEDLPLHGNLEAFIWHADLAKLMGRTNDLLYPLQALSEDMVISHTNEIIAALQTWRESLPEFLRPKTKTLVGQRTFERQNTVLKLGHAHLTVLATRRCLLADFTCLGKSPPLCRQSDRAVYPIQICMGAIGTIIDVCTDLINRKSMYQAFWFTHYIAVVAISTLYVYLIQEARQALPAQLQSFPNIEGYLDKARRCQDYLTSIAPNGSQALRHHRLLDRLKARVDKDITKTRLQNSTVRTVTTDQTSHIQDVRPFDTSASVPCVIGNGPGAPSSWSDQTYLNQFRSHPQPGSSGVSDGLTMLLTASAEDVEFQDLNYWSWESLDTLGFQMNTNTYDTNL